MTRLDRYGRMLCMECGAKMDLIDTNSHDATFHCGECHHQEFIEWNAPPPIAMAMTRRHHKARAA